MSYVAPPINVFEVLARMRYLVKQHRAALRELRGSGQRIIDITARDLALMEVLGFDVDLKTGALTEHDPTERYNLPGRPNILGVPVAGVIVDDAEMGNRVVFYERNGEEG